VLFVPALALALGSLAIGLVPGVGRIALAGAQRFEAGGQYAAAVLSGHVAALPALDVPTAPTVEDIVLGLVITAVSVALGLLVVLPRRLPGMPDGVARVGRAGIRALHALHSGHPGDYVTWLVVGAAAVTAVLAFTLA
jgi:multicomponent Na+:H+ antiporter subunit D